MENLIKLKELTIPEGWVVKWNYFRDIEPDNELPLDEVFAHFCEDMFLALWKDWGEYLIDLGFYGGDYCTNRDGFFRLYVIKGNFHEGILYESFISRSTEEIKNKINHYLQVISPGEVSNLKGYVFNEQEPDIFGIHQYSSIDGNIIKLTKKELQKLKKSKF